MKNQFEIRHLPHPTDSQEAYPKSFVDIRFKGPSILSNSAPVNFIDRSLDKVRFVRVNSLPDVKKQLTAKLYVEHSIDESTIARNKKMTLVTIL